jgi:hypothetical protein
VPDLVDFKAAVGAWYEIDGILQQAQSAAQSKNYSKKAAKLATQRRQNDRAYFLLIFANFEAYLTDKAKNLIVARQGSTQWRVRRGWDVLATAEMGRIPFKNRLAYCLEKTSGDYSTVSKLYTIRNALAHQGTTTLPFIIPLVASDLARIARTLRE